ncbi:DUF2914 domain-containing protein [Agarivorans sp. Z349TD_8]|uniref:DUF2914 domain-containing protein n=1 Tax=Agarivorans sp. Z349TD_8 TaxID=3421434 RepID=UPI003D7F1316
MTEQVSITISIGASATPAQNQAHKVLTPKPPFDLRKIFAAFVVLVALLLLICTLIYRYWPRAPEAHAGAASTALIQRPNQEGSQQDLKSAATPPSSANSQQVSAAASLTERTSESAPQASVQLESVSPQLKLNPDNPASLAEINHEHAAAPPVVVTPAPSTSQRATGKPSAATGQMPPQPEAPASETADLALRAKQAPSDEPTTPPLTHAEHPPATAGTPPRPQSDKRLRANLSPSQIPMPGPQIVDLRVKRGQLTNGIRAREPIDQVRGVSLAQQQQIFLFLELLNMQGQTLEVRWYHQQQLQATVNLAIGGQRWRTKASKRFDSFSLGQWQVVVFAQQKLLYEQDFMVGP